MERQRNWLGWAALILAGLALFVAFGGRFGPPRSVAFVQAADAPSAPNAAGTLRFERIQPRPFAAEPDRELFRPGRDAERFGPGAPERGPTIVMMREPVTHHQGFGHRFGKLGFALALLDALTKLAALGLLAWLLLRLFQQRRSNGNGAPPAPPITPAGHDPRVE
mgnify:CR=1 FL=1